MCLEYLIGRECVLVATNTAKGLSAKETFVNPTKVIVIGVFRALPLVSKSVAAAVATAAPIKDHLRIRDTT
jgi:hypothetical protein